MTDNEQFEELAAKYYKESGLLAPGKDNPIGSFADVDDLRFACWKLWLRKEKEVERLRDELESIATGMRCNPSLAARKVLGESK